MSRVWHALTPGPRSTLRQSGLGELATSCCPRWGLRGAERYSGGAPAASVPVLPGVGLAGFHTEAAMLRSLAHAALGLGEVRKAGQARHGVSQCPGPGLGGQAADHRAEGRNAGRWLEPDDRRPGIASRRALRRSPGGFPHRKKCLRAASASSAGRPAWARTGPGRCGCRGTRHRHGRNRWRCPTGGRRWPRTAARPSRGCARPWSGR